MPALGALKVIRSPVISEAVLSRFRVDLQTRAGLTALTIMYSDRLIGLPRPPLSRSTNSVDTIAMGNYPWAEVLLFEVLYLVVFYPTRQHAYRMVVLAAMFYVATQIYLTPEVIGPLTVTYTVGSMIALHFTFTVYLLFAEGPFPDHWRRVRDEVHAKADDAGSDVVPSNFPLTKKLWWMIDIAYSIRMVGWVQEPRNCLPPHPPPPRLTFLRKTFSKLVINSIIIDLASSVFPSSPAFNSRLHDPTDGPEKYLASIPVLRRAPYILIYAFVHAAGMGAMHNIMALVCVGLGRSSPTLWPDMWGRWEDAYTVGKFWGYVLWRTIHSHPMTMCF